MTYWHSRDGGPWERCTIGSRSIVGWHLSQLQAGEVYDDGYGNRYKWERS
jgi:hypothetical protein